MAEPVIKLLSWNIENLVPYMGTAAEPLAKIAQRLGSPDILCLQEVRIRPQDEELVTAMQQAMPGYRCGFSLARDPRNVTFRGGRAYGVVTYVRDSLGPLRFTILDEDREGRLVIAELAEAGLAIFNLYAVNGTSKPYYDHELGELSGDRHGFKRRFQELLIKQGRLHAARGLELIMIGDWNVSRTKLDIFPRLRTAPPHALARRHLNQELIPALDLVDAFRELHPDARKYTWFNRLAPPGTLDAARVDYALISRSLLERVRSADILEDPAARHRSDHAPLTLAVGPRS